MKRSESILVYAVTAILAVILVVAVVFGDEGGASSGGAGTDPGEQVAERKLGEVLGPGAAGPGGRKLVAEPQSGGSPVRDPSPVASGAEQQSGGRSERPVFGPLRRDGGYTSLAAMIGEFHVEATGDGVNYRVASVRRGDTFSQLVERFTAGTVSVAQVLALNEWVDPVTKLLPAGEQLRFPMVDDAVLVAAHASRVASAPTPEPTRQGSPAPGPREAQPTPAALSSGETYVVQKGEPLWKIAERKVGAGRARDYIESILAANPSIDDANRVRAGQKIVLPPVR